MYRFHNILAAVDTRFDQHPAWEQALSLARATGARITVVDVVPDFGWAARWTGVDTEALIRSLQEQKAERLERLASVGRDNGIDVQTKVLFGATSVALVQEVKSNHHDLVIRTTKGRGSRREGFLGTTSINLLRYCPCAVWLVRPEGSLPNKVIAAAVDASTMDPQHQRLNITVLELAHSLAQILPGSQWHVVYAWMIFGQNLLRQHMSQEELERLVAANEADHRQLLARLLEKAAQPIDTSHVHLIQGDARDAIPQFCQEKQVDILIIGTVGRRGLAGFFIGNTAEYILERVECGILAVKPPPEATAQKEGAA